MCKVKNKKVIRRLADKSFRAARTRNVIAVLAIALTAMLFASLFTIGMGAVETFQLETARQAGTDSHGVFKDVTREQYEKLSAHPLIKESAPCEVVADDVLNPEFLKRHVEAWYVPEYHYGHRFLDIREGRVPQSADEILLDETSLELLGVERKAGQEVTLTFRLGREEPQTVERTFILSGVLRANSAMNAGFAVVSEAYLEEHAEELSYYVEKDEYSRVGRIDMEVSFSNSFGLEDKMERVALESGYSLDENDENCIASNTNWAYLSEGVTADPATVAAIVAGALLILLTGYLIIYNIFHISVIRDIRYYGLLKTIGTTGSQVKRILRRQALRLSVLGIPIGIAGGLLLGNLIVPRIISVSAYAGAEMRFSVNPLIFLGTVVFTLVTVMISVRKPAKVASKVSPVEAVRYTDAGKAKHGKGKMQQKRTTDGGKLWRMALSNLGRSKGRTAVVIISLSLAVILLNSVFTVTGSVDVDKYLKRFSASDFLIGNARYFSHGYFGYENDLGEKALSESFVKACEEQKGFQEGGRIYMTGEMRLEAETYQPTDNVLVDENGELYWMLGNKKVPYDKDAEGNYFCNVYGVEDFPYSKIEITDGEKDPEVIREKLASGKYILASTRVDDNGDVEPENVIFHVGDKVNLITKSGEKKEFEILSLMKEDYYGLTNRFNGNFVFYTTADVFRQMASDKYLMSYLFDVSEGSMEDMAQFVEEYTTTVEPLMHYESKLSLLEEFQGMIDLVYLIGGVLAVVIGIIGILNFVNSILTGIVTRQKEFAMMQAIGMEKRQLVRMLMMEGLAYALLTIIVSLTVGCVFSLTAVRVLSDTLWFMDYHFIIYPMLIVFPFLLIVGAAVPYVAYLPQRKQSIVEEIRRSEE